MMHGSMNKKENQEVNLDQKPEKEKQQSPINKGDEFMLQRRKRQKQKLEEPEKDQPKEEGKKMEFTDLSVVLVFSTLFTVGGTLLGFIFGWFAHTYYEHLTESISDAREEVSLTPHPEMMDEEGNPLPFYVSKLISVDFNQKDPFDTDPFEDND